MCKRNHTLAAGLLTAVCLIAFLAGSAWATSNELRIGSTTATGMPGKISVMTRTLNFASLVDSDGEDVDLEAADTATLFTIPAGTTVLAVEAYVDDDTTPTTTIDIGDSDDADGYIDGLSVGTTGGRACSFQVNNVRSTKTYLFFDADVAASQSAAAWGADPATDVGGAIKGIVCPFVGFVKAISVYSNAAVSTGTLTADATIGGTATGLQAGLNTSDDTTTSYTTQAYGLDPVVAGSVIGAKVTTSADFAATTVDVAVAVEVEANTAASQTRYCFGKYYSAANYLVLTAVGDLPNGKLKVSMVYLKP